MRKILYSPGYGAGWTSWCRNKEVKKLMINYPPIVEALERNEKLTENHPAVLQLIEDITNIFGEDEVPFLGGVADLTIEKVPDGALVRITEYDGFEEVEIKDSYDEWL